MPDATDSGRVEHRDGDWRPHTLNMCMTALACWYLSGLVVALAFSFGFYLLAPAPSSRLAPGEMLDAFTWMDGRWYKQIAVEGYRYDPNDRSNIAFFPVFPLLARAVTMATGVRAEAALLVVAHLSFLAALTMLGAYVQSRRGAGVPPPVDWVVLSAALFPAGCFFRLAYSESTCLLLLVLAMYAIERHWPLWLIAVIIGLATATRAVGVALLLPFAIHIFRRTAASQNDSLSLCGSAVHFLRHSLTPTLMYVSLACWGGILFAAFQYRAFGDPLAGVKAEAHWRICPPITSSEKLLKLLTLGPIRSVYDSSSPAFWAFTDLHGIPWFSLQFANPLYFLAAIALFALGAWRRWLSHEELALAAVLLLIPYLTRGYEMGMGSMGRFAAVAFPVYLVAGELLARLPVAIAAGLLALAGFFLASYVAQYAAGYAIF